MSDSNDKVEVSEGPGDEVTVRWNLSGCATSILWMVVVGALVWSVWGDARYAVRMGVILGVPVEFAGLVVMAAVANLVKRV